MSKQRLYKGDELCQDFGDKGGHSESLLCIWVFILIKELTKRENTLG